MYLVPTLLLVDAAGADAAKRIVEQELGERAVHIGDSRRLSPIAVVTADFDVRVYANNIELPPVQPF